MSTRTTREAIASDAGTPAIELAGEQSPADQEINADAGHPAPEQAPAGLPSSNGKGQKKFWLCLRIVDYRLQALSPVDPQYQLDEQEWCDIGPDSTLSADRESMFQLAREHGGLLVSATGLPSLGKLSALLERIKAAAYG